MNYQDLDQNIKDSLLAYPLYVTLLAANKDGKLDEAEYDAAVRHARSAITSDEPSLRSYFEDAGRNFGDRLKKLDEELPKEREERKTMIMERLGQLEQHTHSLDERSRDEFFKSMNEFKSRVSTAHRTGLEYLIFPMAYSKTIK